MTDRSRPAVVSVTETIRRLLSGESIESATHPEGESSGESDGPSESTASRTASPTASPTASR